MHAQIHANRSVHMRPHSEFYTSSYSVSRKPGYAGWTSPERRVALGAADKLSLSLVYATENATDNAAREEADVEAYRWTAVALFRV